jgi:hypothetical protein
MAKSKSPRKAYRPRPVDPQAAFWVASGKRPIVESGDALLALIFNVSQSMVNLTQGKATRGDIEMLATAANIVEGAVIAGILSGIGSISTDAQAALIAVSRRQKERGSYVLRSSEMAAINTMIDVHDALLRQLNYDQYDKIMQTIQRHATPANPLSTFI